VYDAAVLVATSEQRIGDARLRSALLVERAVRGTVILREGLTFDTRFAAALAGKVEPVAHVFLVVDGRVVWDGGAHTGPVAFVLADDEIERVGPRSRTFRTDGPRVTVIQLRIARELSPWAIGLAHGPVVLREPVWVAARALIEQPTEPRALAALMQALGVPIEITLEEPERMRRLWSVIEPLYAEYGATMSIKQIAGALGLSMRQVGRDAKELASTFGLGDGYRDALLMLRLRTAVVLLSAAEATVVEVARLVGYGSPIAMARAFRDAKLPAPSAVQAELRK
jgi:AraC-like DNA-binding protein